MIIRRKLVLCQLAVVLICWVTVSAGQQLPQQLGPRQDFLQQVAGQAPFGGNPFSTQGHSAITEYDGNLVQYGEQFGDQTITDNQRQNGFQIKLHNFFPFYGGRYNYTMISNNGFISFAYFSDDSSTPVVGLDANWPTDSDPAVIAPYLCKQRIDNSHGVDSKIYYRLEVRRTTSQQSHVQQFGQRPSCFGKSLHFRCDEQSDQFLDAMQRSLMQGVAGASTFRAEAALVVTWKNMRPNLGSERNLATYQLVWMTDAMGLQSYTMINYNKLNFDASDFNGGTRTGKCQAVFNGGNHTGSVQVDLNELTKNQPSSLASRSSVPHVANGRYFHRVDDIVRPAGCSNKTGGTFPLLIYPNIVTMLGQVKVDVNGLCLNPSITYVLMIEQRATAPCEIVNPSIARCTLPKILDWGTKTVYFQPQSGLSNDEKSYVGFIYFVPPTIDPMRLDIGDIHSWFLNPPPSIMNIKWYPRNFSQPRIQSSGQIDLSQINYFDDNVYNIPLGLYVVGYKEAQDENARKFIPQYRVLARLATYTNRGDEHYRWNPMVERLHLDQNVEEWYLSVKEQKKELFTYRFGYLKLAPLVQSDFTPSRDRSVNIELDEGLVSSPVSLHWLWSLRTQETGHNQNDKEAKLAFVKDMSKEMCHDWYDEDGALNNFIRETESNSSCPCMEPQARMDIGRFMPHPRCSVLFRDVSCTETLGAMNCYMSAQNVHGSYRKKTKHGEESGTYQTHYGQTCCYDAKGYLMQSTYQPVIKIDDTTPYSPGFPMRAHEFGAGSYQGMAEIPGLSAFHHDIMPYYLCCKFADFRCQMFYWRRPSSACQAYETPVTGSIQGAGVISTFSNKNLIFNDPGVFTLLHSHKTQNTPEVQIQVRMERFPDRSVDFGSLHIEQKDLVQPTNATVVTGLVVKTDDAERVHVLLNKDTRRGRYKTSIIVGNVLRYFDNMHVQRFKGVTIYVNNVEKGQAEIYVVLEAAQIGIRIRESYAMDVDRKFNYMESLGLLDILVSVPPQFKINREGRIREMNDPVVEGLLNPFPDEIVTNQQSGLYWSNVNDGGTRSQMMRFKVKGDEDTQNSNLHADDISDLFVARSEQERMFQAFADHYLKGPVYKVAGKYQRVPFHAQTEMEFKQFLAFCKTYRIEPEYQTLEERKAYNRCPADLAALEVDCGSDVACLYNAVMLQARLLGDEARQSFNTYSEQRMQAVAKRNSCGAMNIEYPEYLVKGPSTGEPAYLEGDKLSFSCFPTHIIKGDSDYTCRRIKNDYDNNYRTVWTHGAQPWCRHRAKDNILTWLQWTSIAMAILLIPILLFTCCWVHKQKKKSEAANKSRKNTIMEQEMMPLKPLPRLQDEGSIHSSELETLEKEPGAKRPPSASSSLYRPSHTPYQTAPGVPAGYRGSPNVRRGEVSV